MSSPRPLSIVSRGLPWLAGIILLAAGLLVGLVLGNEHSARKLSDARSHTISELATVQAQLDGVMKAALSGTYGIVNLIQHQKSLSRDLFNAMAEQAITNHQQIRGIGYAPNNVIAEIFPREGNEKALGLDYRTIPEQWSTVERAMTSGEPVLSGPVELVQGGRAVIIRAPVFVRSPESLPRTRYWGTISMVGDIDRILADGGVTTTSKLRISLRGKDGLGEIGDMIAGDPAVFLDEPVVTRLYVPGGEWVLAATPAAGWTRMPAVQSPYFIVALLNAALLALFAGLLVSRHQQLHQRHALLIEEIRQRERAEHALHESKGMLHAIVDNAPTLIYAFDLKGRLLLCNQPFEAAIGRAREDMLGRAREEFLSSDCAREHFENDCKVLASGRPMQTEECNVQADGEHTYLTTKCLLHDERGTPIAIVGMSTDITARKRSEDALRLASRVIECTGDGVVVTSPSGAIMTTNPAFTEITGYTAEEVKGKNPSVLKSDRQHADFYRELWAKLKAEGSWQGEIWNRRKNGEIFPEWLTITAVRDNEGIVRNYVGVFSDISVIKRSQADLERLAHFDPLTDLPNRVLFHDRMQHALDRGLRYHHRVGILLLDLDGFKAINDNLGHPVGDQVLQIVAKRLTKCIRVEDTAARLGGDEFAVILSELNDGTDAVEVIQRILAEIQFPFELDSGSGMVTTSIGVAVFPDDGRTATEIVRNADAAMYEAKEAGKNAYRFYQPGMTIDATSRLLTENALRRALENREFEVWFQPQFSLASGAYLGAEALVRWRDPDRGLILPDDFIPMAKRSGLIIPLGEQVLDMVGAAARGWLDDGLDPGKLAINVAGPQIERSDFVASLKTAVETWRLAPSMLEIEITETVLMENAAHGRAVLNDIQALGITTSIDDFGTGYSSLACLKELPIDTIKLDRTFVMNLPKHPSDIAIARAVIAMGHNLGFKVIAEGIETEGQRQFLQQEGCDEGQGFLFARPMPAEAFKLWLRERSAIQSGIAADANLPG